MQKANNSQDILKEDELWRSTCFSRYKNSQILQNFDN